MLRQPNTEALQEMLKHVIRVGVVVSTDPANATVCVRFADADGLVSWPFPVLFSKTHKDQFYHMPDVGDHGVCLCLGNGLEQGFWLGAIYSAGDSAPVNSQDKHHVVYEDGTYHEYDRAEHKQHGQIKGDFDYVIDETAKLHVQDDVEITADADVEITVKGACNVTIMQDAQITVHGDAATTVMGAASIHAEGNCAVRTEAHLTISAANCLELRCDRHGRFNL